MYQGAMMIQQTKIAQHMTILNHFVLRHFLYAHICDSLHYFVFQISGYMMFPL